VLGRRLIFFHHIINQSKRDFIIHQALELGLGGYSKIGWPGVVVVEGEDCNVQEYVRSLQRLRWQHMVVRGEELLEVEEGKGIDDYRALHSGEEAVREQRCASVRTHSVTYGEQALRS
jgi:acylphosphatase